MRRHHEGTKLRQDMKPLREEMGEIDEMKEINKRNNRGLMNFKNLALVLTLLVSLPAWSLVEVRMTYTGIENDPEKDRLYSGSSPIPNTSATTGIGGDLIFNLPLGLALGLRYENLSFSYKGSGLEFEGDSTRTAAVVGWRWLDNLVYLGPVLTYGISHSGGNVKVTENITTTISDLSAEKQSSYSAGLEVGAKLLGFRVGVEAGYMEYLWKDLTGTSGSITSVNKLDMSGSYAKILIGFSI